MAQNLTQVRDHQHTYIDLTLLNLFTQMDSVKEAVIALTSGSDDSWILNCSFALDQNSFIESLALSLLDRIP